MQMPIANGPRKAVMLAVARLIKALKVPHFVMENVCGAASSPVWQHTKAFLKEAGYATTEYTINANDRGVLQNMLRLFAVGSRTATKQSWSKLDALALGFFIQGPDTPTRATEYNGCRRPSDKDSVIGVKDLYWLKDRGNGPCVRNSDFPAPTLLTTCTGWPRKMACCDKNDRKHKRKRSRYAHIRRNQDAGDVDDASILAVREVGVIQGLPYIRTDSPRCVVPWPDD